MKKREAPKGLKKLRRVTGKAPTYECNNCKCKRYSKCNCKRKKTKRNK